jgi:hypothetical protein
VRFRCGELNEHMQQTGTNRFVRGPLSRGWVCEDHLSKEQAEAMYDRIEREGAVRRQAKADAIARRDIEAVKTFFFDGFFKDDAEVMAMCDRWNKESE